MKKILLTTAAVAAISTAAFADMVENQFYLRGDVMGAYNSKFSTNNTKIKAKFGGGLDVGAGYNALDNVRVELVYNRPFLPKFKGSRNLNATPAAPAVGAPTTAGVNTQVSVKHKPTINALFARVSGDVVDLGMAKLYLTAGLGWAQVKDGVTSTTSVATPTAGAAGAAGTVVSSSVVTKTTHNNKNNLAWTAGAGVGFDVADGVHLDVAYSYRDYGKSKSATSQNSGVTYAGTKFRTHNVSAGVRFDI